MICPEWPTPVIQVSCWVSLYSRPPPLPRVNVCVVRHLGSRVHIFPSLLCIFVNDEVCIRHSCFGSFGDFLYSDILQSKDRGNNGYFCLDSSPFPFPQLLLEVHPSWGQVWWEQIKKVGGRGSQMTVPSCRTQIDSELRTRPMPGAFAHLGLKCINILTFYTCWKIRSNFAECI